jgi:type IV pilus assembly protein PilQ
MNTQGLSVSYYTAQGTLNVLGGSPQQIEMIREFINKTDKKQPQAHLEVSIVELNEAGSKTLANAWSLDSRFLKASFGTDGGTNIGGRPEDDRGIFYRDPILPGVPNTFSSTPHIKYTINHLIENKKARMVANPRILITNGQESVIDMTSDYVKSVSSQYQGNNLTPIVTRTYDIGDDQGIKVNITPFISPDGYVTLDITPDYAVEAGKVYAANPDTGEQDLQATLLSRRNLDLKNVRIKDGDTLVIGGMINEKESKTVTKVPVLGDIPIVGTMFRSTGTTKSKEEMIIMITPKIIYDTEDVKSNETL